MPGLPHDLGRLFRDGAAGRWLDADLPPGRLVAPQADGPGADPAYWLSDGPVSPDQWVRLRRAQARSGLWPVLAGALAGNPKMPWAAGEVRPQPVADIGALDADAVLAGLWAAWISDGEDRSDFPELRPFGPAWPGLAQAVGGGRDPDEFADRYVLDHDDGASRLLLVPAERSADVVTAAGWAGPLNHCEDMAPLSALLRSWEDRFGARVIEVGFDTLAVAVAAPPATEAAAQRVAAEHFAFCPDNVVQGSGTIAAYAAAIAAADLWLFWWD